MGSNRGKKGENMTELSEVIKVLEVTSKSVRGNGMNACADSIDWVIEKLSCDDKTCLWRCKENISRGMKQ